MSDVKDAPSDEAKNTGSGQDPNTDGEDVLHGEHPKMTGEGAPGSHSAVFGLTPDGKKEDKTVSSTTAPIKPAHTPADESGEPKSWMVKQLGKLTGGGGGGGEEQDADLKDGEKPGAGSSMTPNQGTGDVRPGEGKGTGPD